MEFAPSLLEPDLRKQWAKKHLQLLKTEIDHFCDNNSGRVEAEEDRENGKFIIKLTSPHIFNAVHAVLTFADFLWNLRSCLDYLASQLILKNGIRPRELSCFPIVSVWNHNGRRRFLAATLGMANPAIAVVHAFQPYHLGSEYRSSHLWRLATLCNTQKHRSIAAFAAIPPWQFKINGYVEKSIDVETEQLGECTILRFPIAIKEYVEFNPDGTGVELRFVESDEGIDLGYQDVVAMYDFVADDLLPAFQGFFV